MDSTENKRKFLLRRIILRNQPGQVTADLEDDFHQFQITLKHDGHKVLDIKGLADRYPWATCCESVNLLEEFVGVVLSDSPSVLLKYADRRAHCTHLFELASLAVIHASRGDTAERVYEAKVPNRIEERTHATLYRNGSLFMDWHLDGTNIVPPGRLAGVDLRQKFMSWAEETLSAEDAEACFILRRAVYISNGRSSNLKRTSGAYEHKSKKSILGACYTYNSENIDRAERMKGFVKDWSDDPEGPLRELVQKVDSKKLQ
ncbi:MAG: hypothetical protein KUG56_06975 [Kordiimonadaceae bacterium]|nr:hypothetical protein [Kordiimonadaceae bacterium]